MHVIAFSDLHHFLGLLVSSSGDVIHHCTTPMTEFHSQSVITSHYVLDWDAVWVGNYHWLWKRTKLYKMD